MRLSLSTVNALVTAHVCPPPDDYRVQDAQGNFGTVVSFHPDDTVDVQWDGWDLAENVSLEDLSNWGNHQS